MNKIINVIKNRKEFIFYSFLKLLIMMLGLVSNIFIVRKLTVNDYGVFSVALMFTGLITTFGFSWSSSSILYYGSKEIAKTGSLNKTFWARNIIISISLLFTTLLFFLYRIEINNYIGADVSFLILIWLYISVAEDYLSQYFLAVKKQLLSSMLSVTAKVIYIIMIYTFSFDVEMLILLNIISHATVLLYLFGFNKKDVNKFEFDKDWFREILNFSLWQLFGFSGLYLINFGDTAVIKYFMTSEDVGVYNAAYKLFNSIASFSFVISSYYAGSVTEYFSTNNKSKLKHFFYRERVLIIGVVIVLHIIAVIVSKPVIISLYGIRYSQSVEVFNVLMIASIFKFFGVFNMLYYNISKKHMLNQVLNILRALLNVGLNIILVPKIGIQGAAVATVIATVLTGIISTIYCENKIYIMIK